MQAKTLAKGEPALWKAAVALCCALAFAVCSGDETSGAVGQPEAASTTVAPSAAESSTSTIRTPTSTAAPTTSPTTTTPEFVLVHDPTLDDRSVSIDFDDPILVVDGVFTAVAPSYESGDRVFHLLRSTNGADWTSEPVVGWPADAYFAADLVETSEGSTAWVEVEGGSVLMTSTDLVTWREEFSPQAELRPLAMAASGDQIVALFMLSSRVITGTLGNGFSGADFPFSSPEGALTGTDDFFIYSLKEAGHGEVAISDDGVSWTSISPTGPETINTIHASADERTILVSASRAETTNGETSNTTSVWVSTDEGATWRESEVPTTLETVEFTETRVGEAGLAVRLTHRSDELLFSNEVWFSPDAEMWTLIDTSQGTSQFYGEPGFDHDLSEGPFIYSSRDLLSIGEDSVAIRVDVWGLYSLGSDFQSGGPRGGFIEQIPVG